MDFSCLEEKTTFIFWIPQTCDAVPSPFGKLDLLMKKSGYYPNNFAACQSCNSPKNQVKCRRYVQSAGSNWCKRCFGKSSGCRATAKALVAIFTSPTPVLFSKTEALTSFFSSLAALVWPGHGAALVSTSSVVRWRSRWRSAERVSQWPTMFAWFSSSILASLSHREIRWVGSKRKVLETRLILWWHVQQADHRRAPTATPPRTAIRNRQTSYLTFSWTLNVRIIHNFVVLRVFLIFFSVGRRANTTWKVWKQLQRIKYNYCQNWFSFNLVKPDIIIILR